MQANGGDVGVVELRRRGVGDTPPYPLYPLTLFMTFKSETKFPPIVLCRSSDN